MPSKIYAPHLSSLGSQLRNVKRDKVALISRFGGTIFLNLLFGLIFLNAARGNNAIEVKFNNNFGALVMVTISCMFGSATPALLAFPLEVSRDSKVVSNRAT